MERREREREESKREREREGVGVPGPRTIVTICCRLAIDEAFVSSSLRGGFSESICDDEPLLHSLHTRTHTTQAAHTGISSSLPRRMMSIPRVERRIMMMMVP